MRQRHNKNVKVKMSNKTRLIKVRNLCKSYGDGEGKTAALCGVSFDVEAGEFLAIMGHSGSGKSTLMHILGFLDHSSQGSYYFKEKDSSRFSEDDLAELRNSQVGFVFQSFYLLPRTTVYENVELPLLYTNKKNNSKEYQKIILEALESVSMEHRMGHLSNQLSGGEKQRVAIARALVNNPEIIFADEPTGNLDSKSGMQVMKILQELNEKGHTIILVTHETSTAQHAKRIITMKDGELAGDEIVLKRKAAMDGAVLK